MSQRIIIERQAADGPRRRTIYEPDVAREGEYWEIEEVRRGGQGWREIGRQHVAEPDVHLEATAPGAARPPAADD